MLISLMQYFIWVWKTKKTKQWTSKLNIYNVIMLQSSQGDPLIAIKKKNFHWEL
jgi:hypothetical protein